MSSRDVKQLKELIGQLDDRLAKLVQAERIARTRYYRDIRDGVECLRAHISELEASEAARLEAAAQEEERRIKAELKCESVRREWANRHTRG